MVGVVMGIFDLECWMQLLSFLCYNIVPLLIMYHPQQSHPIKLLCTVIVSYGIQHMRCSLPIQSVCHNNTIHLHHKDYNGQHTASSHYCFAWSCWFDVLWSEQQRSNLIPFNPIHPVCTIKHTAHGVSATAVFVHTSCLLDLDIIICSATYCLLLHNPICAGCRVKTCINCKWQLKQCFG